MYLCIHLASKDCLTCSVESTSPTRDQSAAWWLPVMFPLSCMTLLRKSVPCQLDSAGPGGGGLFLGLLADVLDSALGWGEGLGEALLWVPVLFCSLLEDTCCEKEILQAGVACSPSSSTLAGSPGTMMPCIVDVDKPSLSAARVCRYSDVPLTDLSG